MGYPDKIIRLLWLNCALFKLTSECKFSMFYNWYILTRIHEYSFRLLSYYKKDFRNLCAEVMCKEAMYSCWSNWWRKMISGSCHWMFLCISVYFFAILKGLALNGEEKSDETRLIDAIMSNYSSAARPVYNASHKVTVKFGITLTQISDMVSFFFVVLLSLFFVCYTLLSPLQKSQELHIMRLLWSQLAFCRNRRWKTLGCFIRRITMALPMLERLCSHQLPMSKFSWSVSSTATTNTRVPWSMLPCLSWLSLVSR